MKLGNYFFNGLYQEKAAKIMMASLLISISFLSSLLSQTLFAEVTSNQSETLVANDFKRKIESINQTLMTNHQEFKSSNIKLADFVDKSLIPIWSSTKSVKGLMGKTIWNELGDDKRQLLINGFNETLHRYVREGFEHYDQQQIEFVNLSLNDKQTYGYLTVKLKPNLLPSFNIDFKVFLQNENWYLYDALVQGASYISLKKDHYRALFNEQKFDGLLNEINQKNSDNLRTSLASAAK